MRRRQFLAVAGAAAVGATLAGCTGGSDDGSGSTGTLATRVTDQPGDIGDFESCIVTIIEIRVAPAAGSEATDTADGDGTEATDTDGGDDDDAENTGDDDDDDAGEESYDVDDAEADLVQLQDGETELVAELELSTGGYDSLKLAVLEAEATLANGDDVEVETPGEAPLKFDERRDTGRHADDLHGRLHAGQAGSVGDYVLQPATDGVEVANGE